MTPLQELADAVGVETVWTDQRGRSHVVADETLVSLVRMLGADIATAADARDALAEVQGERDEEMLAPVVVAWDGAPVTVRLRAADAARGEAATAVVEYEAGAVAEWSVTGPVIEIPAGTPPGIHRLVVECGDRRASATLIAAPSRIEGCGLDRAWGVFVPIYALHRHDRVGTGDLATFGAFAEWASARGAAVIGTLPILATFLGHGAEPLDPSPYQPVSRRFWNEAYLAVDGYADVAPGAIVDLAAVGAAKRARLEEAAVVAAGTSAFESWLDARPDAVDYACYRAALEGGGDDAIRYHEYVQWQMDEQLDGLARSLEARGQALYLDLPVGTHPEGYDVVSQPELFLRDASVGAPPDAFQPEGQNWGFPAIDPAAARRTGYRYLRACLDTHMRYARLLRIDHVMGLHRLWVIPRGMPASQGAYLRYAAEEQWAVLCLAAAQHGAGIVGENLGTVPEVTNAALERHGALGSWVAEFDMPAPPPRLSLAAIGTHDLPTFATWWHELSPSDRGVVLRALRGAGVLDETYGDLLEPHEVLEGLLAWLGSGEAEVVMVALEDLWLEADAQNEPGSQTHQNFCRRAAYGLDDLDSLEMLKRTLDRLDAARKSA